MKILLDETIPAKVRFDFGDFHNVFTVGYMKWLGKKNGELLGLATFNEFDVFITLDRNLKNQQNLKRFKIILILLIAKNNKHQALQLFLKKNSRYFSNG
jgi:hypothetical protein